MKVAYILDFAKFWVAVVNPKVWGIQ